MSGWRGVVGLIKATHRPGSLEQFIRLLPEGIGVIPLILGIKTGTEKEFFDILEVYKSKIAELAELKVDLIVPGGAPPFMVRGYKGERKIIKKLEERYGIPILSPGITQVEALKALGVRRIVGITYFQSDLNKKYAYYLKEAGFEVLGLEGIPIAFSDVGNLSPHEVYNFTKKQFLKHKNAQAIYMLGSGWKIVEFISLIEKDLNIPVIYPLFARIWAIQKRLNVREPIEGYGRLLKEIP